MSRALTVVAIIAAYNEADIIELAVRDLIANGILVYLIDDGSTDDTARLIEPLVGHGVVRIERLGPATDGSRTFSLERLVRRKAQIAGELDADWFINHDADEFRESPWGGVSLLDGIRRVDLAGFNAIDFLNLDFWPTPDRPEPGNDVRTAFTWYSEAAPYNRVQVRCWRKTPEIEVASTGGHDVQFANRRVFPIRFISRHYPIRGQAHGERKVFAERRARFSEKERERHWHVQYDGVPNGASFVRDTCELTRYDGDAVRLSLLLRHRGVEALEQSLAESQKAIASEKDVTEAVRRDVQSAREDVARQSAQIAELNGAVDRMNTELASERHEGRQLRAQLEHAHAVVHARNVELGEVHAQLGRVHADLARTREELGCAHEDIVRRANALDAARAQIAAGQRELASQALELEKARSGLQDLGGRLAAVQQSWSWRLTAPARAILRRMRGY
jgi:glycosyltransferase involved in cell wall biosynthesis